MNSFFQKYAMVYLTPAGWQCNKCAECFKSESAALGHYRTEHPEPVQPERTEREARLIEAMARQAERNAQRRAEQEESA